VKEILVVQTQKSLKVGMVISYKIAFIYELDLSQNGNPV
jgi:hypothetical protein